MEPTVWTLLRKLGCRKHRTVDYFILDEFDTFFYLLLDLTDNPERPETHGSADIHVARIGSMPQESSERILVMSDCREIEILRFMFALGIDRFSDQTRAALIDAEETVGTRTAVGVK